MSRSQSPKKSLSGTKSISLSLTAIFTMSSSLSSSELRSTTTSSSQSPRRSLSDTQFSSLSHTASFTMSSSQSLRRSRSNTLSLTETYTTTFTRFGSLSSSLSVTAGSTLTCTILESATKRISLSTTFVILSQTDVRSQSNSRTLSPLSQTISNVTRTGQPKVSLSVIDSVSHDATHSQSISFWNCSALSEITGVMLPLQEDSAMKIFAASFATFGVLQPVTTYPTLIVPRTDVLVELPSMTLNTGPVERFQLIAAFPLDMSLSLSSPPSAARWLVANVTMGSIPSLKWTSTKSSNTADPWWAIIVEAPEPPNGWLPNSKLVSVFEDRTFELTATMSCDGSAVMQVVFVVPAPGIPQREYADEVKAAGRYSQMVSAFARLSSGITVGRMMATRLSVVRR
ncbi:Hypothetical protein, putative [Bodo saltans]|uniref:Uncharacterized protein n=1 Tax=Bodo saltans TaxID=75058 RepID=A0A0S4IQE8_BODSA|nr:Hypothetical protein, putative [Bodo saltans]|eukprot:CUE61842.1 Hypothetical protein, putative [Bodo saltans]